MICTYNQNKSNKPKSIGSLLLFSSDIIVILRFCTQRHKKEPRKPVFTRLSGIYLIIPTLFKFNYFHSMCLKIVYKMVLNIGRNRGYKVYSTFLVR